MPELRDLVVIETEKAEVEVEAPASGTLVEILAEVKGVYPVGEAIASIDMPGPGEPGASPTRP